MPFAARIQEVSEQLANCRDDALSRKLAQEMQELLHERIEQLRQQAKTLLVLTHHESKQK
jgi:hypothetical protein